MTACCKCCLVDTTTKTIQQHTWPKTIKYEIIYSSMYTNKILNILWKIKTSQMLHCLTVKTWTISTWNNTQINYYQHRIILCLMGLQVWKRVCLSSGNHGLTKSKQLVSCKCSRPSANTSKQKLSARTMGGRDPHPLLSPLPNTGTNETNTTANEPSFVSKLTFNVSWGRWTGIPDDVVNLEGNTSINSSHVTCTGNLSNSLPFILLTKYGPD